jgi:hypothetical protein
MKDFGFTSRPRIFAFPSLKFPCSSQKFPCPRRIFVTASKQAAWVSNKVRPFVTEVPLSVIKVPLLVEEQGTQSLLIPSLLPDGRRFSSWHMQCTSDFPRTVSSFVGLVMVIEHGVSSEFVSTPLPSSPRDLLQIVGTDPFSYSSIAIRNYNRCLNR